MLTLGEYTVNPAFILAYKTESEARLTVYMACTMFPSNNSNVLNVTFKDAATRDETMRLIDQAVGRVPGP